VRHAPPAVLAIDGGNSKTEVALVAMDGTLLALVHGGQSNPQVIGTDEALAVLSDLVRAAAREAGIHSADGAPVARQTLACLAGADLPEEEQHLTDLVQAQHWASSSLVVNDTFAVLRAGLGDEASGPGPCWGIGVTCGAGINCVGVAPDGRTARFLALGEMSGDWGGGGDLAINALWWAARAEDGRGPDTELRTVLPAYFGLAEVREVVIGRYQEKISWDALYGLVPVIFAAASRGDSIACNLVQRQADEICTMASTAARRLGLADEAVPVVLGGSIMAARNPLLTASVNQRLAAELPRATPRIVDMVPVAGAALLGLDRVGGTAGAEQRLRASFAPMKGTGDKIRHGR
jgi:N-acetylglucosamine kinase-like BadF-type ATPase